MCRFLNADGIVQTGQGMLDKNMFAYCMNNPVNMIDSNGNFGLFTILAVATTTALITVALNVLLNKKSNEDLALNAAVAVFNSVIPGVDNIKKGIDVNNAKKNSKKDLKLHAKNVYNANLSRKSRKTEKHIQNLNASIYSSDSDYEKRCFTAIEPLDTYILATGVNASKDWESLSLKEQDHICNNMAYWDKETLFDIRKYYGAEGFANVIF